MVPPGLALAHPLVHLGAQVGAHVVLIVSQPHLVTYVSGHVVLFVGHVNVGGPNSGLVNGHVVLLIVIQVTMWSLMLSVSLPHPELWSLARQPAVPRQPVLALVPQAGLGWGEGGVLGNCHRYSIIGQQLGRKLTIQ